MADVARLAGILDVTKHCSGMITKEARIVMKDQTSGSKVTVKIEKPKNGIFKAIKKSFTQKTKQSTKEPEPAARPPPIPQRRPEVNRELDEDDYQPLDGYYMDNSGIEASPFAPRREPPFPPGNLWESRDDQSDGYIEVPTEDEVGSDIYPPPVLATPPAQRPKFPPPPANLRANRDNQSVDSHIEVHSEGEDEETYLPVDLALEQANDVQAANSPNPPRVTYRPLADTGEPGCNTTVRAMSEYEIGGANDPVNAADGREGDNCMASPDLGSNDVWGSYREDSFGDELEEVYNELRFVYENARRDPVRERLQKDHKGACLPAIAETQGVQSTPDYWTS